MALEAFYAAFEGGKRKLYGQAAAGSRRMLGVGGVKRDEWLGGCMGVRGCYITLALP